VLSSNIQSVAAGGNTEGSIKAVALKSAKNASSSEGAESLSQRLRQDMLKREGSAARRSGNSQATSTLLNTVISAYKVSK